MTDLADREWRLIPEASHRGPVNMALDEVAAGTAADGGPRTLRVYRWDPSTLSLGYRQDPATVDWAHCEDSGVTVTRRPTGGGGIYHDAVGDISYTIVAPAEEVPGDLLDAYDLLCTPIMDAFERMGVDARFVTEERPALYEPACYLRALHPAHDVVGPDGRKLAGNAQYRRKDAVIQHGSLTFRSRPAAHLSVFADPGVTPAEFAERVGSIEEYAGCSREAAVSALEGALGDWADAALGAWTDDELARARELAGEKYESAAWTRERTAP
jgi:lipoate-protein ligase A